MGAVCAARTQGQLELCRKPLRGQKKAQSLKA
jgi:hypothetical protein